MIERKENHTLQFLGGNGMKVLLINGSPKAGGCTAAALTELEKTLQAEGLETERIHVGNQAIRGCVACRSCKKTGDGRKI